MTCTMATLYMLSTPPEHTCLAMHSGNICHSPHLMCQSPVHLSCPVQVLKPIFLACSCTPAWRVLGMLLSASAWHAWMHGCSRWHHVSGQKVLALREASYVEQQAQVPNFELPGVVAISLPHPILFLGSYQNEHFWARILDHTNCNMAHLARTIHGCKPVAWPKKPLGPL